MCACGISKTKGRKSNDFLKLGVHVDFSWHPGSVHVKQTFSQEYCFIGRFAQQLNPFPPLLDVTDGSTFSSATGIFSP